MLESRLVLQPVFKIRKISEVKLEDIHALCGCIMQYILRTEPGVRVDEILRLIQLSINEGAVWFLYKDGDVVGFLTCMLRLDLYGTKICVVDFLNVNEDIYAKGYAKKMATVGIAWVKQQGIKKILFGTNRCPEAMCRFLPGDWKIESTVISLCV